jgi:hypothetical protein
MKWPWSRPAAPSFPNHEETLHMSNGIIDRTIDRFARSPIGRRLAAEQQAEDLAQRRGWIAQRAQLRAELERRQPDLVAAAAAAETREAALAAELAQARDARSAAALAVAAASAQFEAADGVLVRSLRAAPLHKLERDRFGRVVREVPCDAEDLAALCFRCRIRDVKQRLLARADAARAAAKTPGPFPGPINPVTMRAPELWATNAGENQRVLVAVVAAVRQLDALELEALDEADLIVRLAAIEATVPAVTEPVATPAAPMMTPAEERGLAWRLAEQEAQS